MKDDRRSMGKRESDMTGEGMLQAQEIICAIAKGKYENGSQKGLKGIKNVWSIEKDRESDKKQDFKDKTNAHH